MLISASTQTRAETKCGDVIRACDSALVAKDKEIKLCQLGLMQAVDQNHRLASELADKNEKLQSNWRNPFIMTMVGALIGAVAIGFAKK